MFDGGACYNSKAPTYCLQPSCVVVQVTQHAIASGDEITAVVAFETFLDVLEVPAAWMAAFFPALVKLSVESAANQQLELNTREQALQVMSTSAVALTSLTSPRLPLFPCRGSLSRPVLDVIFGVCRL